MKITAEQLVELFPGLPSRRREIYRTFLIAAMEEARIVTRKRAVTFLAQLGHESSDLAHLREIWGPTPAQKRYDTRTDLGNTPELDGDGEFYKGRGGIGRTGKKNYARAERALGLPLLTHPELLERPENAFRSDALYWTDNKLNKLADRLTLKGDAKDLAQFDKITKGINGGYNGRVDRQRRYLVAIDILSDDNFTVPAGPFPGDEPSALDTLHAHLNKPTPPATDTAGAAESNVLSKLSANETAKSAGKSAAGRIASRLGRPLATLWAALEAGNLYAWLGLVVLIIGLAIVVYCERHELAKFGRWTWSKVRSRI